MLGPRPGGKAQWVWNVSLVLGRPKPCLGALGQSGPQPHSHVDSVGGKAIHSHGTLVKIKGCLDGRTRLSSMLLLKARVGHAVKPQHGRWHLWQGDRQGG